MHCKYEESNLMCVNREMCMAFRREAVQEPLFNEVTNTVQSLFCLFRLGSAEVEVIRLLIMSNMIWLSSVVVSIKCVHCTCKMTMMKVCLKRFINTKASEQLPLFLSCVLSGNYIVKSKTWKYSPIGKYL